MNKATVDLEDVNTLADLATDAAQSVTVIRRVLASDPADADAMLMLLEHTLNGLAYSIADLGEKSVTVGGTLTVGYASKVAKGV